MKTLSTIKQGDTFAFIAAITDNVTGDPLTGVADKLKAEVRTSAGVLMATLAVSETETPGNYLFKTNETGAWPAPNVLTDIQYKDGDSVISSETITIPVEKDVTK